ncbi:MAG: hypothetical protein A3E21_07635 [Sulfurimonas sp. RIFCSPHIGHO2_12_FULL_36_9]|uniref:hypothetical protein n=1 Tax=Sulfurimonas sp. RIFCSPLOWO2_12_36_12 TaxID=1802253 RepID=UPI0008BFB0E6|nr:hypothetical protein [Sulfurimonas sp. RIFCSPLOWO2_12_36_12]OHD98192.1 MAG: hypothetical protein A3J26_05230 [Sulfurimonas sp. RIFCSPLOWO2_02_FULL_36_28]OHD98301.1 MAG: hypothetical protein A3E21_07635 [Sulfurimonas sp. RIFCSPHIGHO2_12_FULL_36_9]OHE00664.1 MAG: hypothetical protein A2W82_06640 [Sulfurimonas sp. RIFCSPLOWO2_12_36_12]
MIRLLFLLFPLLLIAQVPFDMSAYETKKSEANLQASKNVKVTCRLVCDKKVYKEQKISDAIEFYKKSKDYKFNRD